jgi:hypothetical protein
MRNRVLAVVGSLSLLVAAGCGDSEPVAGIAEPPVASVGTESEEVRLTNLRHQQGETPNYSQDAVPHFISSENSVILFPTTTEYTVNHANQMRPSHSSRPSVSHGT